MDKISEIKIGSLKINPKIKDINMFTKFST